MSSDIFYDMLKAGNTAEDITKMLNNAQKKLDAEKKAEEEKARKEAEKKAAEAKKKAEFEQELKDARGDLIASLCYYLPLIYPTLCPAEDANPEEWEKFEISLEKYFKILEKEALHPDKSRYSKLFDFWF